MNLKVMVNGLTVLDCDVVEHLRRISLVNGFPIFSPGDHVVIQAKNYQMVIQDYEVIKAIENEEQD